MLPSDKLHREEINEDRVSEKNLIQKCVCVCECVCVRDTDLTLLLRLECSGAMMTHCSLNFPGSGDSYTTAFHVAVTKGACHQALQIFHRDMFL